MSTRTTCGPDCRPATDAERCIGCPAMSQRAAAHKPIELKTDEVRVLAATVSKLIAERDALVGVLVYARTWHNGDQWRSSDDPEKRSAWETHRERLDRAIERCGGGSARRSSPKARTA